jgi:WD40 repeat protein
MATMPESVVSLGLLERGKNYALLSQTLGGQVWMELPGMASPDQLTMPDREIPVSAVSTDGLGRLWISSGSSILRWDDWSPRNGNLPAPSATFSLFAEPNRSGLVNRSFGLTRMPAAISISAQSSRVLVSRGPLLAVLDESISPMFVPVMLANQPDNERQGPQRVIADGPIRELPENEIRNNDQAGDPRRKSGGFRGRDDGRDRPNPINPDGINAVAGNMRNGFFFSRRATITPDGRGILLIRGDTWEYWQIGELLDGPLGKYYSARKMEPPTLAPVQGITSIAISNDNSRIALGSREGVVTIISLPDQRVIHNFEFQSALDQNRQPVQELAFSPDGRMIAVTGRSGVSLWKMESRPIPFFNLPVENLPAITPVWDKGSQNIYIVNDQRNVIKYDIARIMIEFENLGLTN